MSAFIVRNQTINTIVSALDAHKNDFAFILHKLGTLMGTDFVNDGWQEKLAQALYDMNCEAVKQRYGKYEDMVGEKFEYQPVVSSNMVQVYKDIQCLNYQCSEGNVVNRPLYKWLEQVEATVARHIISRLPEYDEAVWG